MNELETKYFTTRAAFREWLKKNHNKSRGIWMVYFKKHTGRENIAYEDALEEALCFGWIDSLLKRTDDASYVRKFTPRMNTKNWSEKNRITAMKLIHEGSMTQAGLKKLWQDAGTETGKKDRKSNLRTKETTVPDFVLEAFRQHEPALTNFNRMAPSHQRNYIRWIMTAKREETILRRLDASIRLLQKDKKLGLK